MNTLQLNMKSRLTIAAIGSSMLLSAACGNKEQPAAPAPVQAVEKPPTPPAAATQEIKAPAAAEPATPGVVAAAEPATPEPAKPASPAPEKPGGQKPERKKLTKADRPKAVEARKSFNRLLEEGRKAVKADKPLEGMKAFEEALTHVPGHPSALGELGWAAYRAGAEHFGKALDATRKALAMSKQPRQKGALYYNLGRIAEDQGDLPGAAINYRTSLGYRPGNAIVEKQLADLEARPGGNIGSAGVVDLEGVCTEIRVELDCPVATSAEGLIAHGCDCATEMISGTAGFGKAVLLKVTGTTESAGGMVDATWLVVEQGGQWRPVTMVGNDWNPGMGYVYNTSTRRAFEFVNIGGRELLWVIFENQNDDLDPGVYTSYSDWSRTLTVCENRDAAVACWEVPLGRGSEVAKFSFDDEQIPEGEGPAQEKKERWALGAVVTADGNIRIITEEGESQVPPEVKPVVGTHGWDGLKGLTGVVKLGF